MTWTRLQADVAAWTHRTDLGDKISGFASLFEAGVNRLLRTRQQETAFSGTIDGSQQIALPADWLAFKTLWPSGDERSTLKAQSLESVVAQGMISGSPTHYAIDGANVRFDGSGDIVGVYYASLPAIETAESNWLSVSAYDAYLFGTLAEAHLYVGDVDMAAPMIARSRSVLDNVIAADQRDRFSGPLVARKR